MKLSDECILMTYPRKIFEQKITFAIFSILIG